MQSRFEAKKHRILELLETPDEDYQDLSPKGSVDESIRPLIADINRLAGLVTTSSCSGRVSVFCEGKKKDGDGAETEGKAEVARPGPGGKGRGSWLYISHDPIKVLEDTDFMSLFGLQPHRSQPNESTVPPCTFIHLKFEPMVYIGTI
jgi:tRNA wybutosine-synthesizing protein 3